MSLHAQIAMLAGALDDGLIDRERAARLLAEHALVRLTVVEALDRLDAHRGLPTGNAALLADVDALLAALDAVKHATNLQEVADSRLRLDTEMALQQEWIRERARARAWDLLRRPIHSHTETKE